MSPKDQARAADLKALEALRQDIAPDVASILEKIDASSGQIASGDGERVIRMLRMTFAGGLDRTFDQQLSALK